MNKIRIAAALAATTAAAFSVALSPASAVSAQPSLTQKLTAQGGQLSADGRWMRMPGGVDVSMGPAASATARPAGSTCGRTAATPAECSSGARPVRRSPTSATTVSTTRCRPGRTAVHTWPAGGPTPASTAPATTCRPAAPRPTAAATPPARSRFTEPPGAEFRKSNSTPAKH